MVDPNSQVLLSHHGNPAAKLDQNRVGKRKAIVDRDLMGQATRENGFNALVELIKPASTEPRQPFDHGDELSSPFIPKPSSPRPQTFKQGQSSSIRGKKGMARARAPLPNSLNAAPLVHTKSNYISLAIIVQHGKS